jgi:hypothetical protein
VGEACFLLPLKFSYLRSSLFNFKIQFTIIFV